MPNIIFYAYNPKNIDKNKVKAFTVKDVLTKYLELYKSKSIVVIEYRDGVYKATIGGEGENYFRKQFSRQQAKNYINN